MKERFVDIKGLGAGLFLFLVISLSIAGCSKSPAKPGPDEVWMQNMAFNPSTLTVPVNTTVKWTNKDTMAHNVTSGTGLFVSSTINPGGTYSYQFTATGTYPYSCTIHPGMTGTIIVQ
jgi:plastocyanin